MEKKNLIKLEKKELNMTKKVERDRVHWNIYGQYNFRSNAEKINKKSYFYFKIKKIIMLKYHEFNITTLTFSSCITK
jgi:hypothetical protein